MEISRKEWALAVAVSLVVVIVLSVPYLLGHFLARPGTYFTGLINPHSVSLTTNVETLLSGILGGIQTLFGAILGTAILKILDLVLSGITQRYLLIMGILFLITIMFAPRGAAGALKHLWDRVTSRTLGSGAPDRGVTEDPFYKDTK